MQLIIAIIFILIADLSWSATENLNEMEVREAKRATNTYFSGATVGNGWVRQPESLMYTDITTGHEVWVLTSTPNESNIYSTDISPANPWSADGARLGFFSTRTVDSFTRTFGSVLDVDKATPFVLRSDGSYIRPTLEASNRQWGSLGMNYFIWSPVTPDTFYGFGEEYNGLSLNKQILYENTVSNSSGSRSELVTLPTLTTGGTDRYSMHKIISPDGSFVVPTNSRTYFPTRVTGTPALLDADGWAEDRGQSNDWGGAEPFATKHDMYFPSSSFMAVLFSTDGTTDPSPQPVIYKYDITGTDTDGGPDYNPSNTTLLSFNVEEAEPLMSWGGTLAPFDPDGSVGHGWGHPDFDRWGRIVLFNDGNAYHSANCVQEWAGVVTWDYVNREYVAQGSNPQPNACPQALINETTTYTNWSAWSDYFATGYGAGTINVGKYDTLSADGNWWKVADFHGNTNSATVYHWQNNPRVSQSPDGTKISASLSFLTSVANTGDIAYAVAYYPHPPEIISVSSGVVRFDWRTDQTTSRGYTQRGWPSEATDDPPPPRETQKFRLWKSADGSTGWTPVGTVDADIFTMYDFSDGTWAGVKYWEITDPSPSGYYAVTSVEWSGLESRTLSNVFNAAGTQTAAYPADPKADADIISSYNADLKRYYNIYAEDGATPTISQTNRIASIPLVSGEAYVDWLGDTGGTTQYVVTAVDTQGNESAALVVTSAHQQSPATVEGQYSLTWAAAEATGRASMTAAGTTATMSSAGTPVMAQ